MRTGERRESPADAELGNPHAVFPSELAADGSGPEFIAHANDILFTHALHGNFSYVNQAGTRITGHSRQSLMRLSLVDLAAPEYREAARRIIQGEFEGRLGEWSFPLEIVARDGRRLALEVTSQLVYVDGRPAGIRGIARDVSEARRAQKELRELESRFLALAELTGGATFVCQESKIVMVNRASEVLSGYSRAELLTMDFQDLVHPDHRDLVRSRLARQSFDKSPAPYELKLRNKAGEEQWVRMAATVIPYQGRFAVLATAFALTGKELGGDQDAEAAPSSTASHLEQLFENTPAGIVALDRQGRALQANGEFGRMFGFAPAQFVGRDLEALIVPPERRDEAMALRQYMASGGKFRVESVRQHQNGDPINVSILGIPVPGEGPVAGYAIYRDITNRRATEQALVESEAQFHALEQRYQSLFAQVHYGIYRATMEGRILDANPALARMLGYESTEELLQLDITRDVYADSAEPDRLLNELRMEGRQVCETGWRRKDGRLITVRLSAIASPRTAEMVETMEVIVEDVTEQRALEEQFRQSQKMEGIGRLAGGVAHDFNNLLTVIKGYSELVLFQTEEGDATRPQLEEILNAADRAATLTRQLLAFSRRQVLAPKVLELNSVVSNMEKLLGRLLGEDMELLTVLDPALHPVKADPGQLEQVIMNLAVNARDAMPMGGQLIIETANVTLDETYHSSVLPGDYVMLAVIDSGQGMTEEIRSRVFEPFFTTKERGTGLGLSTVYGIVKQSGGHVWVYSEVGRGSAFKVYLPRVDELPDTRQPVTPEESGYWGTETVLLVEDEAGVRTLISQVLQRYGYTVLEAPNGAEALLICNRHRGAIHLLLTDVVLSQTSGPQVAARLAVLRPEMRTVFMSGYSEDTIVQHGLVKPGIDFLQKPFTAEDLVHKLREILDSPKHLKQ
jgi:PAS domain S-box-containing protein